MKGETETSLQFSPPFGGPVVLKLCIRADFISRESGRN